MRIQALFARKSTADTAVARGNYPPATAERRGRLRAGAFAEDTLTYAARQFMRGLTPSRMASIFDAASTHIADQIVLAHELEESDDHLKGTLRLRRAAVLKLETKIVPGDEKDAKSVAAAELAEEILATPWFYEASEDLLRATFLQWAAVEIFYENFMPVGKRAVESGRFHFREQTAGRDSGERGARRDSRTSGAGSGVGSGASGDTEVGPGELGLMARIGNTSDLIAPTPGRFMLMSVGATARPGELAEIRCAAKLAFLHGLVLTQWGTTIDQFGVPAIALQYAESLSTSQVQGMVDELLALAARRVIATPAGTNTEMHDIPDTTPHSEFTEMLERRMSRLIVGQDSSQMPKVGQDTGANLAGDVRDDIRDADARRLDAAQNETFFAPWCAWTFGPGVKPPRIERVQPEELDPEQRGRVFAAARALGLRIKTEQVYDELKLEQPADAPEFLEPQVAGNGPQATGDDDIAFKRAMVLAWIADGTISDIIYNATDIEKLLGEVNVATEPNYEEPWVPVQTADGGTVTGEPLKDSDGDVVGSQVIPPVRPQGMFARLAKEKPALEKDTKGEKTGFEGLLERVRFIAGHADSLEAFRDKLAKLLDREEVPAELETALLGAFATGRLQTAEEVAGRRRATLAGAGAGAGRDSRGRGARRDSRTSGSRTSGSRTSTSLLAGGDDETPGLQRARFSEAIDSFAQRSDLMRKEDFLKLKGAARSKAWTVARVAELDVMKDLHAAVGTAIEGGQSWREFKDSLDTIMEQRGWAGLQPWHANLVYEQNVKMAQSAGRSTQAQDAGLQYWRKLPSPSANPRPEHASFDHEVFTFQQKTPPPWDFGCNCEWEVVFDDELNPEERARIGGPAEQPPGADEFEWDASHYFRPVELRRGDYPQEFWPLIDALEKDKNALLKLRDA